METKPKYVKFEQNAVIILDDIDSRSIPLRDLKFCGFCTLPDKRPVYHYSPSAPAKPPVSDGRTSENRSDSNEKRTAQGRGATWETGGGFTIISMGKIGDEDKKSDFVGSVKMQTAKDIFSELDKVINNPESIIDTESRLKYTEIKQKYTNV